jgi:D-alanine-D-alanine ligase
LVDLNDFSVNIEGQKINFDVVFMAIHGTPAEDGKLQGYFDLMDIPYTCCGTLASAITFDKDVCKQLLKDTGVKMAKSILLNQSNRDENLIVQNLSFPVFVKPNKNGSSYGISKVKEKQFLAEAVEKAFQFDDEVLVEEFIAGREFGCGVIEKDKALIALPMTEIITQREFFDYEAKYLGEAQEITPPNNLPDHKVLECQEISKKIYRQLKLKGAVRMDYFLNGEDFYLLEVNTIPGLSEASILPQQAEAHGWSLATFFDIILTETLRSN